MSGAPTVDGRGRMTLRVMASYALALAIGSALLGPLMGPLVFVVPVVGFVFGLPALAVAIVAAAIFHRSIRARPLAWCLAAPFVAIGVPFAVDCLLEAAASGGMGAFDIGGPAGRAAYGLYFAVIAAACFYVLQRRAARRSGAQALLVD